MLLFLISVWWFKNEGGSFNGLPDEDINWSGPLKEKYKGEGIVINVMSDGALFDHIMIKNRGVEDQFIDTFTDKQIKTVQNPEKNWIGMASLGLAAGSFNENCKSEGVAPSAHVASFYFSNSTDYHEDPEFVLCKNSEKWNISILQYQMTNCQDRFCRYIEPDVISHEILNDCLYKPINGQKPHPFVVPGGSDHTSDPLFSPPGRWPLMFTIAGVSNRGIPYNHGAEGVGIFMQAPAAGLDAIPTASPINETSCLTNFTTPNASAAIFAGGLAVIMQANPNLTLADLFFVTAMTADKTTPKSVKWETNSFGLSFSRRAGFGRLNLGKAVSLVTDEEKPWKSVGDFYKWKKNVTTNLILEKGDYNITINFDEPEAKSILDVRVTMKAAKLSFGSLNPHLVSPTETRSELKIISEGDRKLNIRNMEFPSRMFLGENPNGNWTLIFREADDANRGFIENVELEIYYTKIAPDANLINQGDGKNPFEPIDNSRVKFAVPDYYPMIAGKSWSVPVIVEPEARGVDYLSYLQDENGFDRVKIRGIFVDNFSRVYLNLAPTVFADGLKMSFVIESQDPQYGFTATLKLNYTNTYPVGFISPKDGDIIPIEQKDLVIFYALHLKKICDDGYSTSAALTILSATSKTILDRKFFRNIGNTTYSDAVPSDRSFLLQLSPSSSDRFEPFGPFTIKLYVKEAQGQYDPPESRLTHTVTIFITILFGLLIVASVYRTIVHATAKVQKKMNDDEMELLGKI